MHRMLAIAIYFFMLFCTVLSRNPCLEPEKDPKIHSLHPFNHSDGTQHCFFVPTEGFDEFYNLKTTTEQAMQLCGTFGAGILRDADQEIHSFLVQKTSVEQRWRGHIPLGIKDVDIRVHDSYNVTAYITWYNGPPTIRVILPITNMVPGQWQNYEQSGDINLSTSNGFWYTEPPGSVTGGANMVLCHHDPKYPLNNGSSTSSLSESTSSTSESTSSLARSTHSGGYSATTTKTTPADALMASSDSSSSTFAPTSRAPEYEECATVLVITFTVLSIV